MIPINRENVRDIIIAVLCIAAACGLFYLAGCGKPCETAPIPSRSNQSISLIGKLGDWQLSSTGEPIEVTPGGIGHGEGYHPLPAKDLGTFTSQPREAQQPPSKTVAGDLPSAFDPTSPNFQGPFDNATSKPEDCIAETLVNNSYKWVKSPKGAFLPTPPYTVAVSCNISQTPLMAENLPAKVESEGQSGAIEGIAQLHGHPMGEQNPPIVVNEGDGTGESEPPSKCLIYNGTKWVDCPPPKAPLPFNKRPPECPNKLQALAVMLPDPSFPDVWRRAYLCNAREIAPVPSSTKWRYVDQKRYGYREWEQK